MKHRLLQSLQHVHQYLAHDFCTALFEEGGICLIAMVVIGLCSGDVGGVTGDHHSSAKGGVFLDKFGRSREHLALGFHKAYIADAESAQCPLFCCIHGDAADNGVGVVSGGEAVLHTLLGGGIPALGAEDGADFRAWVIM